ncbi:LPS export ABC transporter permease LptF [Candidatus Pseudothioglobus sp. Uisw_086]|uniref:LPS export ABC transporter permease LptF n=1 Tax=Candidatus Pseudothioglobus sp. Uisw_086 TaxID=3230998 RepID=UPI003A862CA5
MFFKIFNFQNTIISRYLLRNLLSYFFAIFFIISLIVFGNQFVLTVQESVEFGIPVSELMPLIGFNMLRDVPIILTLSLFLSIIVSISQLYNSSEAVVMNAIGFGEKSFINAIKPVIIISFLVVAILSIYIVPWAKQEKNITEDETVNASEFSFITEGRFEVFKDGDIVFYASESISTDSVEEQNMEEIFIYALNEDTPIIVLAKEAKKYTDSITKGIYLQLKDGTRYEGLPGDENANILDFDLYDLEIVSSEVVKSSSSESNIQEINTIDLIKGGDVYANAELQWRLSQPLSVLILSVFGIFLGKTSLRTGKGINILIGMALFMLYNNSLMIAKSSIEVGQLNPLIGMWAIHMFLLVMLLFFYQFRQGKVSYFIDKIASFNYREKRHV